MNEPDSIQRAHPLVWVMVIAAGFAAACLALFAGYVVARALLPVIAMLSIPVIGAMAGVGARQE